MNPGKVARLSAWVRSHARVVIVGWLVLLVVAMGAAHAAKNNFSNNVSLGGTGSQHATDLLTRDFPARAGDTDEIVFRASTGRVDSTSNRASVAAVLASVAHLPHVTSVASPFGSAAAHTVSSTGRIAFATITFDQRADLLPKSAVKRVIAVARSKQT